MKSLTFRIITPFFFKEFTYSKKKKTSYNIYNILRYKDTMNIYIF